MKKSIIRNYSLFIIHYSLLAFTVAVHGGDGACACGVADIELRTDHLNCRVLALKKNTFTYYAGAAWSKAGEITTAKEWRECIMNFRKEINK